MRARRTGAAARIVLALAGAAVLALGTPAAQALPRAATSTVSPSGTSTLRGVLVHGDPAAPVGGAKVTLNGVASGADALTLTATTDSAGRFVFGSLAGGDAWSYTVTSVSSGTEFSTNTLSVKAGETLTTTLQTYDVTTKPDAVSRPEWLVWLDVEGSTLAVQQDLTLKNTGTAAYTGSVPVQGAPDNGKAAVTLPIAQGATSLSYLGSFEVCCDATSGSTWAHTRPVPPGTTTGTLRYEAPLPSSLAFPITSPTQAFTLLVPTGTEVSSPQLTPSGTQSDRGTTYQVLKGGPLAVGTTVTVTFGAGASSGPGAALVAAGVVGLVAVAVIVWWLLRRRSAARATTAARPGAEAGAAKGAATTKPKQTQKQTPKPTAKQTASKQPTSTASQASAAPTKAAAARPSAEDPDVLADELAMLDLAHESGSLPDEESYQRVRAALVDRLVAALGEDPDALTR